VAASHHDSVELVDDVFEVVDCLRFLDLRDDGQLDVFLGHDLVHAVDVGTVAHKRQRDQVCAEPEGPAQVVLVLLRQCGYVHGNTGPVDALVVRYRSGDDDPGQSGRASGGAGV